MNAVIVGAGSMGLLIGSFLAEAGMAVTYFVKREEQARLICEEGIERIHPDGVTSHYNVKATTDSRQLEPNAIWIVATKFTGLSDVLAEMQYIGVKSPVLFIQNGIAHLALVKNTNLPHIAFATVEHGAKRINDRTVSHNGVGLLTIATARGDKHVFDQLLHAQMLEFPIRYDADAEQILMRKVLINCMINPLTAILKVKNGELLTNQYCRTLFDTLYKELMVAFPEMAELLPYGDVENVCRKTAANQSSMLVDCLEARPMEIETIVSAVIQKANERHKPLQLLITLETMLYAINVSEEGV